MATQDAALAARERTRSLNVRESNRERLLRQTGSGKGLAASLISSMSRPMSTSQGGTTLLRVEGRK